MWGVVMVMLHMPRKMSASNAVWHIKSKPKMRCKNINKPRCVLLLVRIMSKFNDYVCQIAKKVVRDDSKERTLKTFSFFV